MAVDSDLSLAQEQAAVEAGHLVPMEPAVAGTGSLVPVEPAGLAVELVQLAEVVGTRQLFAPLMLLFWCLLVV